MNTNPNSQPLTGSRKIYVPGQLHHIRVAMREISLTDTMSQVGTSKIRHPNAPVTVYDTSGPCTDPDVAIDLKQGLPRLRESWITSRGDVEQLTGGRGCFLSAAITAELAGGHSLVEASRRVRRYTQHYLQSSPALLDFHRSFPQPIA